MFVYSPPVLRLPTGSMFHEVQGARPPRVIGGVRTAKIGGSIELRCPVFGYPQPWTRWEKDGAPLDNPLLVYDGDNIVIPNVMRTWQEHTDALLTTPSLCSLYGPAMP
ncbi:hypothetical protein OESDEN_19565, partial [Oesophagostomum dentatum]